MYAQVENNQIVEWPIVDLRRRFPNISFPVEIKDSHLPEGIVAVVSMPVPAFDAQTQKPVQESVPSFRNGRWELGYVVEPQTPQEIQATRDARAVGVRLERNQWLSACDWTQLPDAPDQIRAAYVQYRQSLRDVPQQAGFPFSVVWPAEPSV